ncbi:MAG: T9SS type A sorting domain-containing protein, partial [Candidatus Cloacimonadaceae bacterium]|nr:T9SS type A sorting domain-containing protein [Candidatus Cloacimonadaceae bacterium]
KNITFFWTTDDDNGFPWSETRVPAVFQGATEITEGAVWDSGNPRTITVPVSTFGSKADFRIGLQGGDTLPIELSSFNGILLSNGRVRLDWVTQSETNVNGYYLLRSISDNIWHAEIVSPLIQAQNTSTTMYYSFEDREIPGDGLYSYWLQNVDFDGSTDYHGPVIVDVNSGDSTTPPIPVKTELTNLYPNPFNPDLNIVYSLKNRADVALDIINVRGQVVRTLVQDSKNPGRYNIRWDGRDDLGAACGTGIYFVRFVAGKDMSIRKAVLVK